MILIKVLTKTKYLSFHFAFECAQRGFVCTTPARHPSTNPAAQRDNIIIKQPKNSICIWHLNMQNAKLRKGSTAIYYEQQRSFQSCNNKHAHLHVYWCVCVCVINPQIHLYSVRRTMRRMINKTAISTLGLVSGCRIGFHSFSLIASSALRICCIFNSL